MNTSKSSNTLNMSKTPEESIVKPSDSEKISLAEFMSNYYFLETPLINYIIVYLITFILFITFDLSSSKRIYLLILMFTIINLFQFLRCPGYRNGLLYCWNYECEKKIVYYLLRILLVISGCYLYQNYKIIV